ncbi:hypothetical protein [Peribacillus muralis]|uniref:hypothetical protein n=1 Tax=Peribacillus muralis TaxID=264697 RepID=UPI00070D0D03|nr:hypothetical protein [Peribacillus muralis]
MTLFWILFKQNRFLNVLILLIAILFFFLVLILVVNMNQASIETRTVSNFEGKNVYQLSDDLVNDKEISFFSSGEGYDTLSKFNNKLSTSSKFITYTANWQPIELADFKGDRSFDPNYQYGDEPNPTIKLNGHVYTRVLSLQINDSVFDMNALQVTKGRKFTKKEYIYNSNTNEIPVILGNDYSRMYKLGDNLNILVYGKEFKGQIIGFFGPSQKIMTANEPEVMLDKYIILPALTFKTKVSNYLPKDPDAQVFFSATLYATANSLLITEASPLEIRKDMEHISKYSGFEDFQIIGANGIAIDTLFSMTKANLTLIYLAIAITFLIALCAYTFILYSKVKRNIDTYSVLLISGANMDYIKKSIIAEFLLISTVGIIVPVIPFALLLGGSFSFLINYLFVSVIFLIIMLIIIQILVKKVYAKVDIVQQLKR